MIRALVGILGLAVIASCEPGSTASPSPTATATLPTLGSVTMRDNGCTYAGLHHPAVAGSALWLRLFDEHKSGFNVHLYLLGDSYHYADWSAAFLANHGSVSQHARKVSDGHSQPGTDALMTASFAKAGTYGMVCAPLRDGKEYGVGYTAGAIVVRAPGSDATPAAGGIAPAVRGYASVADIPGSGFLVYGGFTRPPNPNFINDMWAYNPRDEHGRWRQLKTAANPDVSDSGLLCLATCAQLLYVDGAGKAFVYDVASGTWRAQKQIGHSLHGMRAAYDSESRRVIEFGGDNFDSVPLDETWAYDADADTWTRMHPVQSPPARYWHGMVYDRRLDRVVVYGGYGLHDQALGDTWFFDFNHDTWTEVATADAPSARGYVAMAYDADGGRTVLYGGETAPDNRSTLDDTWTFDAAAANWTELEGAAGPGPRAWHTLAYDAEERAIVMFAGGASRDYDNAVWMLTSANQWTSAG